MNYRSEAMADIKYAHKPNWQPAKHLNYLMELGAGDVIENLYIGNVTKKDAPRNDETVIVTIWEDTNKTLFVLRLDQPYRSNLCYWDAFVLARQTVSIPEIRPDRLLEKRHAY